MTDILDKTFNHDGSEALPLNAVRFGADGSVTEINDGISGSSKVVSQAAHKLLRILTDSNQDEENEVA